MNGAERPGLRYGIYSYREAARLLGVTTARVKRWADGYVFPRKHDKGHSAPVLQTDREPGVLSFPELWELMFVKEYVALQVPLPQIRATAEALAKTVGPYPFTSETLLVNGREMLIESADGILARPDVGQLVADYARELLTHVEIRKERVGRYVVPTFERIVYLDQSMRGGEPLASERGIPTRLIYSLWEKEKDIASVAEYYELDEREVSAAIRYEGQWRLAA